MAYSLSSPGEWTIWDEPLNSKQKVIAAMRTMTAAALITNGVIIGSGLLIAHSYRPEGPVDLVEEAIRAEELSQQATARPAPERVEPIPHIESVEVSRGDALEAIRSDN